MKFHMLRHGGKSTGDALELLGDEITVVHELVDGWSTTKADPSSPRTAVHDNWERGTIGKLLIEHGAVRLAAEGEIARVLETFGEQALADELRADAASAHVVVAKMNETSRGVEPMSLAISEVFAEAVEQLRERLVGEASAEETVGRLNRALGPHRGELPSADFVRRHAPTHPGSRWRLSPLTRLHTIYDRMRGIPWAQSTTADRKLTELYDKEVT